MRRILRRHVFLLLASLAFAMAAHGQEPPPLFRPAPVALAKAASSNFAKGEFVLNQAFASVDWRSFLQPGAATANSPDAVARRLKLNLMAGADLLADRVRMRWEGPGRFTWVGRIGEDPVVLSVWDGAVHGMVQAGGRTYEIESLPGGSQGAIQRIAEQDQAAFAANEQDHPDSCGTAEAAASEAPAAGPAGAPDPVIDVMILYDKTVAGRTADMKAYLNSLIEMSNESYRISGIPQTVRLVHSAEVTSGITGSHNSWMGQDVKVKAWRDQYGADLVAMLIETGFSYCGVASGAFTTTKRSCAVGNKTFTHELGHNMGANHAWEQFTTHNGFAYGYINHAKSWRTVMSYAECDDGGRCTRLLNFSNPDVKYNGDPTGIADSRDNARKIRSRSLPISEYRPTKVGLPVGILVEDGRPGPGYALRRLSPTSASLILDAPERLEISMVGLGGRRTALLSGAFQAGELSLDWAGRGLETGLHILQIRGERGQSAVKMPVLP